MGLGYFGRQMAGFEDFVLHFRGNLLVVPWTERSYVDPALITITPLASHPEPSYVCPPVSALNLLLPLPFSFSCP